MAKKRGRPRKVTDGVVENIELSELENNPTDPKDEVIEVESDEENATHTTEYPIKDDSDIVGKGTNADYNPFAESVVERDYSTPKVASGVVEDIEEPTFIPPSYEDIINEKQTTQDTFTDNPFDNPNPPLNDLDTQDKKIACESLVDTVLDGYEQLHTLAQQMVKVDDDVLIEKQTQGKLDLQETIPIDENGNTLTVAEFFGQYNKQSEQALTYDKEFGYKVRPAMVRVFMKKGWGMTDEQFLAIQFGKDILQKTMIVYSLKKTLNNTIATLEKAHKMKSKNAYTSTVYTNTEPISDDPVKDFENEMKASQSEPEIVEELTPEPEIVEEKTEDFTSSLEINMPKNPKDGGLSKHPKEIRSEIKKTRGGKK